MFCCACHPEISMTTKTNPILHTVWGDCHNQNQTKLCCNLALCWAQQRHKQQLGRTLDSCSFGKSIWCFYFEANPNGLRNRVGLFENASMSTVKTLFLIHSALEQWDGQKQQSSVEQKNEWCVQSGFPLCWWWVLLIFFVCSVSVFCCLLIPMCCTKKGQE